MKRLTVRADEVRVGDRLADPDTGEAGGAVTDTAADYEWYRLTPGGAFTGAGMPAVEIWTVADPDGMPAVTLPADDPVEVWR